MRRPDSSEEFGAPFGVNSDDNSASLSSSGLHDFVCQNEGLKLRSLTKRRATMAISADKRVTSAVTAGVKRPQRLHHAAWVTRDSEATRKFYEDVIGLPLVATWAEQAPMGGGKIREYVHKFFAFGDGGALAFFQHADQDER